MTQGPQFVLQKKDFKYLMDIFRWIYWKRLFISIFWTRHFSIANIMIFKLNDHKGVWVFVFLESLKFDWLIDWLIDWLNYRYTCLSGLWIYVCEFSTKCIDLINKYNVWNLFFCRQTMVAGVRNCAKNSIVLLMHRQTMNCLRYFPK